MPGTMIYKQQLIREAMYVLHALSFTSDCEVQLPWFKSTTKVRHAFNKLPPVSYVQGAK